MPQFTGFAKLRTSHDLLLKLQHDMTRISNDSSDVYAAFDFFVTAEHLVDWLHPYPNSGNDQKALRNSNPLLKITSHLANGAKHFAATHNRHKSVASVENDGYADDYFEDDYVEEPIVITLTDQEADTFGCRQIDAIALARQVLAYWQEKITGAA
ncbi:MAG: hypothetical protein EAZ11_04595 [Curvibacter sp.]|nr:MAG: hypothetical protein EAZ11_04595 [Curvibacter sp.]